MITSKSLCPSPSTQNSSLLTLPPKNCLSPWDLSWLIHWWTMLPMCCQIRILDRSWPKPSILRVTLFDFMQVTGRQSFQWLRINGTLSHLKFNKQSLFNIRSQTAFYRFKCQLFHRFYRTLWFTTIILHSTIFHWLRPHHKQSRWQCLRIILGMREGICWLKKRIPWTWTWLWTYLLTILLRIWCWSSWYRIRRRSDGTGHVFRLIKQTLQGSMSWTRPFTHALLTQCRTWSTWF